MSSSSNANSLASEVVCSADKSLNIHVQQINSLQFVNELPELWALDISTGSEEAMDLLMEILLLMETTSVPGLYSVSIVGVNSRILFEIQKGKHIYDIFKHTKYATRVQYAALLKPNQIVKHFCNNARMLPLVPGKLVQLHDSIRKGQAAQIIDTDIANNKVLVKFYPTIDYKGLGKNNLNSQRQYEARFGRNVELKPAQFYPGVLKTTKSELMIHGKPISMISWDDNLYYNYYQYEWLPIKYIKYNVQFPINDAIKFRREKADFEEKIPNFEKELEKSIEKIQAKQVRNAVVVDAHRAKREEEKRRKRMEQLKKEKQLEEEKRNREADELVRKMKPKPGDILIDSNTNLIVKIDGYDRESGKMIGTPVPIPLAIQRDKLVKTTDEEKAHVESQIGVDLGLSSHPGRYVDIEVQSGLSQSEILERSMAVQVDNIEPVRVNTNFVRLFDLRRVTATGEVVAVAAKTYPTFVGINLDNNEITLKDDEVEKKLKVASNSVLDKHGGRLLVGDRVRTADGISGIARTAYDGRVFVELEGGGLKWIAGSELRSLGNAGMRKRTLIGAMIQLSDGNQAVITGVDTTAGVFTLKDKYDRPGKVRFDTCGGEWNFSKESGY